jgi:hypothetical protein
MCCDFGVSVVAVARSAGYVASRLRSALGNGTTRLGDIKLTADGCSVNRHSADVRRLLTNVCCCAGVG